MDWTGAGVDGDKVEAFASGIKTENPAGFDLRPVIGFKAAVAP